MQQQQTIYLKWKYLWLIMGWGLIILVTTFSLSSTVPQTFDYKFSDKIGHILAYFTLMGWFSMIYHQNFQRILLLLSFFLMGLLMEYLQSLTPTRYAEWQDLVANTIGIILAWLVMKTAVSRTLLKIERFWLK